MVTPEDVESERSHYDITLDIEQEAKKYGRVRSVVLPRVGGARGGVGRAFIEFDSVADAKNAADHLHGREFGGNKVEARFYEEARFYDKNFGA